jgi:hypothetical protein
MSTWRARTPSHTCNSPWAVEAFRRRLMYSISDESYTICRAKRRLNDQIRPRHG